MATRRGKQQKSFDVLAQIHFSNTIITYHSHRNVRSVIYRSATKKMTTCRGKQQDCFQWSDNEVKLLLTLTYEYKVKHSGECTDWEKVKTKYADILALFWEQLPSGTEEASQLEKDYPHHPDQITLKCLTSKLKAIRLKYRQAIDSGKKSGHGRVIMCYFDLCNKIWGGSPATVQISSGLESTDLSPTSTPDGGEPSAVVPDVADMTPEGPPPDTEGEIDREEEETDPPMSQQALDTDGAVQCRGQAMKIMIPLARDGHC